MENADSLFEGKRAPKPVSTQNEPDRLYAQIGQLNMELDRPVTHSLVYDKKKRLQEEINPFDSLLLQVLGEE